MNFNFLITPLSFAFALGVIVFVHEAGHLLVAKAFGVRVLTFSLGFGKRLWGFRKGETDYRLSLVPLGGYVRLGGENPDEVTDDPNSEDYGRTRSFLVNRAIAEYAARKGHKLKIERARQGRPRKTDAA